MLLIYSNLESALHQGASRPHWKTAGSASPQGVAELRDPRGPVRKKATPTLPMAPGCQGGAEGTMDKKHAGKHGKKVGAKKKTRGNAAAAALGSSPFPPQPDQTPNSKLFNYGWSGRGYGSTGAWTVSLNKVGKANIKVRFCLPPFF